MAAVAAGSPSLIQGRQAGWIYKPSWDLPLLILSAILVPLPFLAAWILESHGVSQEKAIDWINIAVGALIGGPHLFSTITYTLLDSGFRTRHARYAAFAILI